MAGKVRPSPINAPSAAMAGMNLSDIFSSLLSDEMRMRLEPLLDLVEQGLKLVQPLRADGLPEPAVQPVDEGLALRDDHAPVWRKAGHAAAGLAGSGGL